MHDDPQQLELLRVARIGRAQGLKGEVTVRLYTDDPEWRFEPDSVLYSQDGETEYIVEGSRTFKDRWILKLEGVDDRNAAEALNGVELYGEVDDAEDMLEADEWYPKDLIGLEARLVEGNGLGLPAGQVVGKVVDVIDSPAQSLLKIRLTEPVVTGQNSKGEDVVEKTALVPVRGGLGPRHRSGGAISHARSARRPDSGLRHDLTHRGRCACSAPLCSVGSQKGAPRHGSYPSTAWSGPDGRRPRHRAAAVTRPMKRSRNSGTSTPKATCVCLSGS